MLFYRLEQVGKVDKGCVNIGPYTSSGCGSIGDILDGWEVRCTVGAYKLSHPAPDDDPGLSKHDILSGKYRFGFSSEEGLRKWFCLIDSTEPTVLAKVQISVFEVPDGHCIIGTFQAVAEVDYMKRIDTWRPKRRK